MSRLALVVLVVFSAGCSAWRGPSSDWNALVTGAEGLDDRALAAELDQAVEAHSASPSDATRLRLAYLLSRPGTSVQDLGASQEYLNAIGPSSPYASVRDLLRREISLVAQLESARHIADLQAARLEAIGAELGDQAALQDELARMQERCEALRTQLEDAERRLGALKAIDSDLAEGDERPGGDGR